MTMTSNRFARSKSCVTTIIVLFSSSRFNNKSMTIFPFFVSNDPVGSSAKMIFGSFNISLANATLCCSPPLRELTILLISKSRLTFLILLSLSSYYLFYSFWTLGLNLNFDWLFDFQVKQNFETNTLTYIYKNRLSF